MNSKAIRKQLFAAVAMVLVAAVALGSSTYAWFAANRQVTATGMKVSATTSSSLVISNVSNVGTETTHGFTSDATTIAPASHAWSRFTTVSGTNTTNLVYNDNPTKVSAKTGYKGGTDVLTFAYATNAEGATPYYVDYDVYIASAGSTIPNQDITVDITNAISTELKTYNATSVDFYAALVSDPDASITTKENDGTFKNYKGTLNIANLDASTNDGSTQSANSGKVTLLNNITVPQNGKTGTVTDGYIKVTMRVYIDGDLMQAAATGSGESAVPAQAFVYSNVVDTTALSVAVQFDCQNHTP